jgi:hypothetical protein
MEWTVEARDGTAKRTFPLTAENLYVAMNAAMECAALLTTSGHATSKRIWTQGSITLINERGERRSLRKARPTYLRLVRSS